MIRILLAAAALSGIVCTPVLAADWTVDTARSHIGFSGTQTGSPFQGRFDRFSIAVRFDPGHPETTRIVAVIDLASAHTGDPQRDTALPGADWFDVAHGRVARFEADGARRTGPNSYIAQGRLTIRGQTKPVALPFTVRIDGTSAHATGRAHLIRSAFGIGQGQWASGQWVALDVGVDIDVIARATN